MSIFFQNVTSDWGSYYIPTIWGYSAFIVMIVALLLIASFIGNKKGGKFGTRQLVFSAMAISIALVMSMLRMFRLPMGGSVTVFSMLFVCLVGYWYGLRAGILAAVSYGILQLLIDPYVIHPMQLVMDYILAFGSLGLSGLFSNKKHGLIWGYLVGVTGRFLFSFLSGMIFFASAAAEYNMFLPVYSAVYNGSYIYAEAVITIILLLLPPVSKALKAIKRMAIDGVSKKESAVPRDPS